MKRILFFLLVAVSAQFVNAQNVGIGTTSPNASAKLDISSTTQGLLIPRMTSTQRTNILTPADGLMVYDNTSDRLYQYQAGAWKTFNNNDYWATNGTDLYNTNLNVGIGNANPIEKLHVTGNIRVTGDLFSTGEITMNNATGTVQIQNAGVNKVFVQLSGDNLRMGTNSGNTTGNMVIRMNGNDRITINPSGDIDLDGKITTPNTGIVNMLPLCFGQIDADGTILSGSGNFTITKAVEGYYLINCAGITNKAVILVMAPSVVRMAVGFYLAAGIAQIRTFYRASGGDTDSPFNFIIYKIL
ncbi:MAG: hypothetical protein WAU88_03725 [Candidatus Zixiibacteriota bacterium]